jgi:hypothetical protein
MAGLSRTGFVLIAFGGMSLCMKMETYYQKNHVKEQIKAHYQPESSIPFSYQNDLIPEEKEYILKDIYTSIDAWQKLCELFQSYKQKRDKIV